MTQVRLLAALIMAPVAIAAILLLPTPWMMALAAVVFLIGLWEWFDLAEVEDTLARTVLLVANLALMVAIVWASRSAGGYSYVLFKLASVIGVVWWLRGARLAAELFLRQQSSVLGAHVQARGRRAGGDSGLVRAGLDPRDRTQRPPVAVHRTGDRLGRR